MQAAEFEYSAVNLWAALSGRADYQAVILDSLVAGVHHAAQRATYLHPEVAPDDVAEIVFQRMGLSLNLRNNPSAFFQSGAATKLFNMHDDADSERIRGLLNELARAATSQLVHGRKVERSLWKALRSLFVIRR